MTGPALSELTTLRVGGPAGELVTVTDAEDLVAEVRRADAAGLPVLLLGGGSNLLVCDEGFDGRVIRIATRGISADREGEHVVVDVAAGEPWDAVVRRSVEEGWSGLEALSGIPGSTGATPIQNVGAYGAEVAHTLDRVTVLHRASGRTGTMPPTELGFGYRTSVLKRDPGAHVVLSVRFRLRVDALSAPVRYAELARTLGVAPGERAPLAEVRGAVLDLRRGKGMVLDPADHDTWSAGSFFTNPVIPAERAAGLPEAAPRFPQPDGTVKTSAAWLIAHAGFDRGYALEPGARAALSTKHTLAITNRGGASADEVLALARAIRSGVAERFGIVLENEPVLVGCRL